MRQLKRVGGYLRYEGVGSVAISVFVGVVVGTGVGVALSAILQLRNWI